MKGNVELLDMCMYIVFAFQLIRAKEVKIVKEVKEAITCCLQLIIEVRVRSEEKLREMLSCWICVCVLYLPFN